MISTYDRTTFHPNLEEATIEVVVTEKIKYADENWDAFHRVSYTGVKSFSIINGEDAIEIEEHTDGSCIDEYHEYLVLKFADGTESTFRNSHANMYIH